MNQVFPGHSYRPPPKRPMPTWVKVLIILGILFAGLVGCGVMVVALSGPPTVRSTDSSTQAPQAPGEPVEVSTSAVPEPPAKVGLAPGDVAITLRATQKDCFGSAGCLVTLEPEFSAPKGDLAGCRITYQVTGDKDGISINTWHVGGAFNMPTMITIPTAKTTSAASVTAVRC